MLAVRITFVNFEHTCQLSVLSLCESLKLSSSRKELHREEIRSALKFLMNNPVCEAIHLHPHLEKALSNRYFIGASHMANFCQFANRYWL